jgi:hypothetical protein
LFFPFSFAQQSGIVVLPYAFVEIVQINLFQNQGVKGGAIWAHSYSTVVVRNSALNMNVAQNGGGVCLCVFVCVFFKCFFVVLYFLFVFVCVCLRICLCLYLISFFYFLFSAIYVDTNANVTEAEAYSTINNNEASQNGGGEKKKKTNTK